MKRLPAYPLYLLLSGMIALAQAIMFTTAAVYYITAVGMNPLQLVLVGTVLELTILLFEVPTGVVADTYSRRLSVIIGVFVLGVAWTLEGALPLYIAIIGAEIIRGVGETFLSGALDAWLADEVGEEHVGPIYLRSGQIGRVLSLIGAGIGVACASVALNLPMLIGGGMFMLLGVCLVCWMPEHGFSPASRNDRTTFHAMWRTFRDGARVVRRSQTLTLLLIVGVFAGVASEGFDRLWEAHLLQNFRLPSIGNFQPIVWFGIISVATNILTFGVTEVFRRRLERISRVPTATARVLVALNIGAVLSVIVFGLAGNVALALGALLVQAVLRSLVGPLYNAWIVQHIDPKVRATALSMINQTDALGQTMGGPGVGALGTLSLRAAMVVAGALLSPAVWLYAREARRTPAADRSDGAALAPDVP